MLALLGSLLGFATSAMPDIFSFFQDKRDKSHELEIMTKQAEIEKERETAIATLDKDKQIALAHVNRDLVESQGERDHDIDILKAVNAQNRALNNRVKPTGDKWLDRLRGSVRPLITYWWMLLYSGVKVSLIVWVFNQENIDLLTAVNVIWTEQDIAVFASIIAFWFGHKMMDKRRAEAAATPPPPPPVIKEDEDDFDTAKDK